MSEKEREMKIKSIAKEKGLTTKRMPGKGKETRYLGTIPNKYKGKVMIVQEKNYGDIYDDDGEDIIGDMDDAEKKIQYYFYEIGIGEDAINELKTLQGIVSVDTTTDLKGEVDKLMSSYGIR